MDTETIYALQECNDLALGVYYATVFAHDGLAYYKLEFKAENSQSPERDTIVDATMDFKYLLPQARIHAEARAVERKQKRSHEFAFFMMDMAQTVSKVHASQYVGGRHE